MARVLGIGGVFFRSEDPEKLGAWYARWLGVPVEHPWGASFQPDDRPGKAFGVWAPFNQDTEYFPPRSRSCSTWWWTISTGRSPR